MSVRIESQSEPIPGYRLLDRLGAGGFGEVWRAEAPGGIYKAIKVIHGDLRSKDHDLIRYAEQELKALKRVKQVRHPYLLALDRYDIVDGRLLIVMELADCNLWDRFRECRERGLPGIPRDELLVYMAEAAEVLDLMNDQFQLQHLDIKPQNLFLLYNHVKVADFGQVKDLQGMLASVTGGITPVYAAPETFDGVVSRYCDQYSLACVYQELLTGQRPFDGTSMSQLLMQHLQLPPDLVPSPPCDRPALTRALAKRAEDRWPSVSAFVRALRDAGSTSGTVSTPGSRFGGEPLGSGDRPLPATPLSDHGLAGPVPETPFPLAMAEIESNQPAPAEAPPEQTGPGPLRPALVIGIGQAGLRVVQKLRFELAERFGPPEYTPLVRTVFIDTDPDTLDDAVKPRPLERLAGLSSDDVFPAKLNRATHYLKPRMNSRSLIDGWFDPQLLYKIPRTSHTLGLRLFGRLAFCDHYRPLMAEIQAHLDACLNPDALFVAEQRTGLRQRTNRPRVYVAAGLAGGTGGGMFLDVAYAVRTRLKRMGYAEPDIIGILMVPPADPILTPTQAIGNTYAALTELHHYSRPETAFTALYDDRHGQVRDNDPPFTSYYLVPGSATGLLAHRTTPPGSGVIGVSRSNTPTSIPQPGSNPRLPGLSGATLKPSSRTLPNAATKRVPDPAAALAALKPYADAAELIRLDLFTSVGRVADEVRLVKEADATAVGVRCGVFGLAAFAWPRALVVGRTAAAVTRVMLNNWLAPDPDRVRSVIPGWAATRWTQLGLEPEAILGHLQLAAENAAGVRVEEEVAQLTEPLVPRGWLARLPDPDKVAIALDQLVQLLGPPAGAQKRPPTPLQVALGEAALAAADGFAIDLRPVGPGLVEDPQFRLAGAEEVLRQFLTTTDRLLDKYQLAATDADARAVAGYECLANYMHGHKGARKPTAAEFTDALRQWPRARFQAVMSRRLVGVYQAVRHALATQLADVVNCRQRMEEVAAQVPKLSSSEPPSGPRRLMPPGCGTVAEAVERFLGVLTDDDMIEIDRRVQAVLEPDVGGLYRACLNSTAGSAGVLAILREETRAYLEMRLGEVDLGAMFAERFRSQQAAQHAVAQAFSEAEPDWVGAGPWCATEVTVVGAPAGPAGEPVRELARRAIPVAGLPLADGDDDMTIYREFPAVPLGAVPQLGPAAAAAYQSLPEVNQCTLHARMDITQ